jgi:heme/copper-type cytochrome/quinol oxidase subunit 3
MGAASRLANRGPLEVSAGDNRRRLPFADASTAKVGMWVFLATDAMGFGGLLLAEALLRARASTWPDPALRLDRSLAAGLTFVLLASGATMTAALGAAREGRVAAARRLLLATATLGLVFVLGQAVEFRALVVDRHVRLTTDHAAGLFFVLTGYHGLHVLAGVVMLVTRRIPLDGVSGGQRPPAMIPGLEVVALYWQFVDVVWIVIFAVLYLAPGVIRG